MINKYAPKVQHKPNDAFDKAMYDDPEQMAAVKAKRDQIIADWMRKNEHKLKPDKPPGKIVDFKQFRQKRDGF